MTAERIDELRPDERAKREVRSAFEERGFAVHDAGITLTIEGDPQLFERALGVELEVDPSPAPGEPIATPSGEPGVPEEVRGLVDAVVFPKRAHMFGIRTRGEESHGEG